MTWYHHTSVISSPKAQIALCMSCATRRLIWNCPRRSLVTGKDVSLIVEQKRGMNYLKRLSGHRHCSLFSLFLPIVITFSDSCIHIYFLLCLVFLSGGPFANQLRVKGLWSSSKILKWMCQPNHIVILGRGTKSPPRLRWLALRLFVG